MLNVYLGAMYGLLLILGASLASFLNVVVIRYPQMRRGETWLGRRITLSHPPSRCMSCESPLKWYDNIPVLGWIKLKGKCRFCGTSFSIRYALFELVGGLVFIAPPALMGLNVQTVMLGGVCLVTLYIPSVWRSMHLGKEGKKA